MEAAPASCRAWARGRRTLVESGGRRPGAAVDGGRGHACGRALGGAAHTSPRRSPSRLHFLTCLFTSFPLLLSLSLEIQERAERAAWPRRQHQRRLERQPERWTQRLENWISSELSGIQVPQPGTTP